MPLSPARRFAFDVLLAVEQREAYASTLLHSAEGERLADNDQRLAMQIVLGVLRWRGQLDFVIGTRVKRPLAKLDPAVLTVLRMGIYQLRHLERAPASAVVNDAVNLTRRARCSSAAGLVNAVLRACPRQPIAELLTGHPEAHAVELSHPEWLLRRWTENFSAAVADGIAAHDNAVPPTTLHVDTTRLSMAEVQAQLGAAGVKTQASGLLQCALHVETGDARKSPLFASGEIWIQDEASQLVALLLGAGGTSPILDCCAAPGGKTAILRERHPEAPILALDLHPHRAQLLKRLRHRHRVEVATADVSRPLPTAQRFERILADLPCSGTGTLARNPEIRWRLGVADIERMARTQRAIVGNVAAALAPGGRMVYSVCSLEPEEGGAVVNALLGDDPGLRLVPAAEVLLELGGMVLHPGLTRGPFLLTTPGAVPGDGFFAAVLTRHS